MKMMIRTLFFLFSLLGFASAQNQPSAGVQASVDENGAGAVTLTAKGVLPKPALFFTAGVQSLATVTARRVEQESALSIKVLQGRPELMTLALAGDGEVVSVTGKGLADWAVRRSADGKRRFLDLKPVLVKGSQGPKSMTLTVKSKHELKSLPAKMSMLVINPGEAVGYRSRLEVQVRGVDARVAKVRGLSPLEKEWTFTSAGEHGLDLQVYPSGGAPGAVELRNARLTGSIDDALGSALFRYTATAYVSDADGGGIDFLSGRAAVSRIQEGAAYSLHVRPDGNGYRLVFDRAGEFPVNLEMIARIDDRHGSWQGWNVLDFTTPQGAVVPVVFKGLAKDLLFAEGQALMPRHEDRDGADEWRTFLPASGHCFLAWKKGRKGGDGKLAFTCRGLTDVSVGAGLMRQTSEFQLKILQGKLNTLSLRMQGAGEVLDVEGTHIAGWKVEPSPEGAAGDRVLKVQLSLPLKDAGVVQIRTQQALQPFPVTASPMRLTPVGVLRHSGFLRLRNAGAVRLGTSGVQGLMQLSPDKYPSGKINARQVFAFRYPSADYDWKVSADQILPEVSLNQVVVYQQTESDRLIHSNMELDIREAPLREWELRVPDGYAVAALNGAEVADYVVGTTVEKGLRDIKVLFKKAVSGRQLIQLRLEKNAPPAEGLWSLPVLEFPNVKNARGHVGVAAAAGWRVTSETSEKLSETPLSYFPIKMTDLQQSYRFRESDWRSEIKIEARGQSVQADVFHLYSLKEGMAYGSVVLNYFVVGAPVNQWELSIPESYGNVNIEGQNVRQWRRVEGDKVLVQLESPVSGSATLLVTYENAMSARGGTLALGEVRPVNVQSESGFIEVVSPVLVNHQVSKTSPGLLKVSAQELPAEFRMLTTAPSQVAWQYAARPFELAIDIAWFKRGETLEQVVDFAELSSKVSRDGQVTTVAEFYVRTRGRQALRMTLPSASKLWDARADGSRIAARRDGEQYLLPLPVGDNPNQPVRVQVRYGSRPEQGASGKKVSLGAPVLTAPVIIAGWKVSAEQGRLLVPEDADAGVRKEPLTETGFESLQGRSLRLLLIGICFLVGVIGLRRGKRAGWLYALAAVGLFLSICLSWTLAKEVWLERRVNQSAIEITAQVVSPDAPVQVMLKNIAPWQAMVSWMGVAAGVVGVITLLASLLFKSLPVFWLRVLGVAMLAGGMLAQRGGAVGLLILVGVLAVILLLWVLIRGFGHWSKWNGERQEARRTQQAEEEEALSLGAADGVMKLLVLGLGLAGMLSGASLKAADEVRSIDTMEQTWRIEKGRLFAQVDISLQGKVGGSHLLLREPAVLTSFEGDGLRVSKLKQGKVHVWMLAVERDGLITGRATYEMALPKNRGDFMLPTGMASVQKLKAVIDEPGLELYSSAAVQTVRGEDTKRSVELVLAPLPQIAIGVRARGRDIDAEETKFYAEVANLYLPSPGVVDGIHQVTIRPSSGKVGSLTMKVPEGFTVGEVLAKEVANWRFDPGSRSLTVEVLPAQSRAFSIRVETQRGLKALPADTRLASMTVDGDAGETNMLGLAFGSEAQPGKITVDEMSAVNVDDFDRSLIPTVAGNKKQARGILHKVYRSASGVGSVNLQVAPVMPELRVVTSQELTLGSERTLLSAVIQANITRAGIFQLSFVVPEGMEMESLSGPALSHWTENDSKGKRQVTMHLNGRTIGQQQFALTLTGTPVGEQSEWQVPRLLLDDAVRQSGQLIVIPEKGIRVRAVNRNKVSRLNAQLNQSINVRVKQSGGLAFRILQSDWSLSLGIEQLEAWITASVLHEVTLREGQTRTRLSTIYQIDHAAVKSIQVVLPGLSDDEARTVRASGAAVKGISRLDGERWEIVFRRGVLGQVPVQIEYQRSADRGKGGEESILPAVLEKTKRSTYFVAVRTTGRLDMQADRPGHGWRRSDWAAVAAKLRNPADTSMPDLCYRLNDPEGPLKVTLKRHEMANTLKLRVTGGRMMTVFSPGGESLTSVHLDARVLEKTKLKVTLPQQAVLYNVLVNEASVNVVREGETHLFHVAPSSPDSDQASVSLVYSTPSGQGDIRLSAPSFNVPLESMAWDVLVPEGYRLDSYVGGFDLRGSQGVQDYHLDDYLSMISSKQSEEARQGVVSLQKASDYMKVGKRKEAAKELEKVTKNRSVDAASNEDARVQLFQLQTQQAVWGLNSRRQRMYLDNKAAGNGVKANDALEDAANSNPLFQGKQEFDVRQVDDFLRGNSLEEKQALKNIAKRLIGQQLATEPAPQTISTIVRGRGEVLRFTRGIQVEGDSSLGLELDIESTSGVKSSWVLMLLFGFGLVGAASMTRKVESA
ncbi:MFS transporter [Verrucomicrobiaceae bacterium N1E253]|uniref:MFS transporter n=1 Tax=Oceaniferula marina TaxID=2748318 RepID=A0A851GNN1_9BACT|nr:MFS transporter [Oceaniferula marina]NWK55744.1 MFS transporter [Oceaniferula marina]